MGQWIRALAVAAVGAVAMFSAVALIGAVIGQVIVDLAGSPRGLPSSAGVAALVGLSVVGAIAFGAYCFWAEYRRQEFIRVGSNGR